MDYFMHAASESPSGKRGRYFRAKVIFCVSGHLRFVTGFPLQQRSPSVQELRPDWQARAGRLHE